MLLLLIALSQNSLHLFNPGIEGLSPSDLFEHLEEAFFALGHKALDLALLHDLELRLPLKREATSLTNVEQLFLLDVNTI